MDISSIKKAFSELFTINSKSESKNIDSSLRVGETKVRDVTSPKSEVLYGRSSSYTTDLSGGGYARSSVFVSDIGKNDFHRSSSYTFDVSQTWWKSIPKVVKFFLSFAFLPILLVRYILDFSLTLIVVVTLGSIFLWLFGFIPDETVTIFLTNIGDRLLLMAESLGLKL